jgi:CubicO group peptidase (beta-lactamase class C family)
MLRDDPPFGSRLTREGGMPIETSAGLRPLVSQNGAEGVGWYTESEVQGTCPDRFRGVRDVIIDHLESGADVGASVAAYIDGVPVIDLWGGYFDMTYTRPWEKDTIVNVFSTTRTMTALSALVLADRGELDYDAPVAHYFPEFAAAGKATITVR